MNLREKLLVHLEISEKVSGDEKIRKCAEQTELVRDVQREKTRDEAHSLHIAEIRPINREDLETLLQFASQRRTHAKQLQCAMIDRWLVSNTRRFATDRRLRRAAIARDRL